SRHPPRPFPARGRGAVLNAAPHLLGRFPDPRRGSRERAYPFRGSIVTSRGRRRSAKRHESSEHFSEGRGRRAPPGRKSSWVPRLRETYGVEPGGLEHEITGK